MIQNGRPRDEPIGMDECVYVRWFSDWFDTSGNFNPAQMLMPGQSGNRSGHAGRDWYVLIADRRESEHVSAFKRRAQRQLCMGIVAVRADSLPLSHVIDGRDLVFRLDHVPLEFNYHHCQFEVVEDGVLLQKEELDALPNSNDSAKRWKKAKKWFRTQMSNAWSDGKVTYVLESEVATGGSR